MDKIFTIIGKLAVAFVIIVVLLKVTCSFSRKFNYPGVTEKICDYSYQSNDHKTILGL